MDQSLASHSPTPTSCVSTAELLAAALRGPSLVERGPRTLAVVGVPIAAVGPDPSRLNPLSATSAEGMPAIEIFAAIASQDPSGILVIELPRGGGGFGFALEHGRVVGARGPGSLGQLERWCAEVHQRFPGRFKGGPTDASGVLDPLWMDIARNFVREHAVEYLQAAAAVGTRLTFLRGDVRWLGTTLPVERAPGLQHVLLEQARRQDELPGLLNKLGATDQLVLPMSSPGERPPVGGGSGASPAANVLAGDSEGDWGFDEEPDPEAEQAWDDARTVWGLCDGRHTIDELVAQAMLGRFRTLRALVLLARHQHVVVAGDPLPRDPRERAAVHPDPGPPTGPAAEVLQLPRRPPPVRTEYSMVRKLPSKPKVSERPSRPARRSSRVTPSRRPPPPPPPAVPAPTARNPSARVPTKSHVRVPDDLQLPSSSALYRLDERVADDEPSSNHALDLDTAELSALTVASRALETPEETGAARRTRARQLAVLTLLGAVLFAGGAALAFTLSHASPRTATPSSK